MNALCPAGRSITHFNKLPLWWRLLQKVIKSLKMTSSVEAPQRRNGRTIPIAVIAPVWADKNIPQQPPSRTPNIFPLAMCAGDQGGIHSADSVAKRFLNWSKRNVGGGVGGTNSHWSSYSTNADFYLTQCRLPSSSCTHYLGKIPYECIMSIRETDNSLCTIKLPKCALCMCPLTILYAEMWWKCPLKLLFCHLNWP